jgi:cytochrome b
MTDPANTEETGPGIRRVRAWDLFVRVFHWSLVTLVALDAFVLDPEKEPHAIVGYLIAALIVLRLVWGFVGARTARFSAFPPDIAAARVHARSLMNSGKEEPHLSHNPLGALMVYNLLATLALITATGVAMQTDMFWGVDWVEGLHETLVNWLLVSVVLHVAGVVFETRRSGVNLVQAMVTGWKNLPDQSA